MLSLGLGLEKVADTRRKTAANLGLLLLFLLLLLKSDKSEDYMR